MNAEQAASKLRFAVLASGNGSNACKLIEKAHELSSLCEVSVCISDQIGAPVLTKAKNLGVDTTELPVEASKRDQELKLIAILKERSIDWIFLAGYMRILSHHVLNVFPRIVNIHPSLLPRHPGLHAYERSYADEHADAGVTIHFVDAGIDSGPIIAQQSFEKISGESFEQFHKRGMAIEHELYPRVLERIARGDLT